MTTKPVMSITDEQLAELEQAVAESMLYAIQIDTARIAALITRLRAAEADAKRYRWLFTVHSSEAAVVLSDEKTWVDAKIDSAM